MYMEDIYEKKTLIDNGIDIDKNYKLINDAIDIEVSNAKTIRDLLKKKITKKSKTSEEDFSKNLENFLNNEEIDDDMLKQYKKLIENINYLRERYTKDKQGRRHIVRIWFESVLSEKTYNLNDDTLWDTPYPWVYNGALTMMRESLQWVGVDSVAKAMQAE